ncbi:MAG: hypothetical protein ABIP03_07750, partial [Aquihabitans sp.]
EGCTRAAGAALWLDKDLCRFWTHVANAMDGQRRRRRRPCDDALEYSYCHEAAEMLLARGFDAVVFGHTHHAEVADLPSGTYLNSGNWLHGHTYVDIDHGDVSLKVWGPSVSG